MGGGRLSDHVIYNNIQIRLKRDGIETRCKSNYIEPRDCPLPSLSSLFHANSDENIARNCDICQILSARIGESRYSPSYKCWLRENAADEFILTRGYTNAKQGKRGNRSVGRASGRVVADDSLLGS